MANVERWASQVAVPTVTREIDDQTAIKVADGAVESSRGNWKRCIPPARKQAIRCETRALGCASVLSPDLDAHLDDGRGDPQNHAVRDDDVRSACFAALDVLQAKWGADVPYATLAEGFNFCGWRVPFLNRGLRDLPVERRTALTGRPVPQQLLPSRTGTSTSRHPTACFIATRATTRRTTSTAGCGGPTCSTCRSYFVGTRLNWYRPIYPTYVEQDEPAELRVLLTFGKMRGPYDEREPVHIPDGIERRYVVREVKQRIHQAQFRGAVLLAYRDRCTICRLREVQLLDAAHIVGDAEEQGNPAVSNGLSFCSIHHRAFDEDLVGIDANLRVHVSRRLLDDEDGPMLDVLKGFHGTTIEAPSSPLASGSRAPRHPFERFTAPREPGVRSGSVHGTSDRRPTSRLL